MVSSYTHTTALKIYAAIADSGKSGVGVEQLANATKLAENTLRTYARWLEDDGAIAIEGVHSNAQNRSLKNLYLAIREPRIRVSEQERLKQITELLMPYSKHPKSWDKAYKSEIIEAIKKAIQMSVNQHP